jgi:hypothetical protein
MARPELGGIVTILHGRPPTTKTAKITKIVTILHNPEIPSLLRMRIIIIPTGVRGRENENHYHSQGDRGRLIENENHYHSQAENENHSHQEKIVQTH